MNQIIKGLSKHLNTPNIINFCSNSNIHDIEAIKSEFESISDVLSNILVGIEEVEIFNIVPNIIIKDSIIDNIKLVIIFKIKEEPSAKTVIKVHRDFDKLKAQFESIIELIIDGSIAVSKLNKEIRNIQVNKGSTIAVNYKWDIEDTICSVTDWDYDKINIKLSRSAISELINLNDKGELINIIHSENWNTTIKEVVDNFNKNELHLKIGAIIKGLRLEEILVKNMLSIEDVMSIIKCNREFKGIQTFKSVSMVNELGRFIVICKWVVDYNKKSINMSIMQDKVLDLDKGIYINNQELCNRIEKKLIIPDNVYNIIFKNYS